MTTYTFGSEAEGLQFKIDVTQDGANASFTVTLLYGSMNVNALYWSDGDATAGEGSLFTLTKSTNALNMNGATFEGETVAWDGSTFLSNAGLGSTPPATYLTSVGATYSGSISNVTVDQLAYLGVRATSTTSEGGSIKWISDPDPVAPPPPDHFPDFKDAFGHDISHVTFYFDTDYGDVKPINDKVDGNPKDTLPDGDGWFTVKIDNVPGAASDDLDDWFDEALAYIQTANPTLDVSTLQGVAIKGSTIEQFFALDNDPNDVDPFPVSPPIENNEVDQSYDYSLLNVPLV